MDRRRAELAKIHIAKTDRNMTEEDYRCMLHVVAGVDSAADLDAKGRRMVLDHLYGGKSKRQYPKRPRNMEGHSSRAEQLQKIEALLTIGKRPWAYADALAKSICKVEKVEWVPDYDLYKIITALRKQAQREGWDLSGER
jgi:phage gp16-like protein